jgi:hypothetical protein
MTFFRTICIISLMTIGLHAQAAAEEDLRDLVLTAPQAALYHVAAPQTAAGALDVTAWVDRSNNTYHVGENIQLYVKANKDAYITVLNVGASGNVIMLFPNQFQPDNFIRGGQIVEVPRPSSPAKITVSAPVGTELIKVIASTKTRQVVSQTTLQPAGPWSVVTVSSIQLSRDLTLSMQGSPVGATGASVSTTPVVEPGEWDEYNKVIRTVPAPPGATIAPTGLEPVAVMVPSALPPQQSTVTPIVATSWAHSATASGPFPLVISIPKPRFAVGEAVPIQLVTQSACNLMLTTANNQLLYPPSGQPVLIQANQPVIINGLTAQMSQTLVATCVPLMASSDLAGGVPVAAVQLGFTVQ